MDNQFTAILALDSKADQYAPRVAMKDCKNLFRVGQNYYYLYNQEEFDKAFKAGQIDIIKSHHTYLGKDTGYYVFKQDYSFDSPLRKFLVVKRNTLCTQCFDSSKEVSIWVWGKDFRDYIFIKNEQKVILPDNCSISEFEKLLETS